MATSHYGICPRTGLRRVSQVPSYLDFSNRREAIDFLRGFCVPRVVVDIRSCSNRPRCAYPLERYLIVSPETARRNGWPVVS